MIELPIDPFLPRVLDALRGGRDVVLVAEPGAGKTTRVPAAVVESGLLGDGKLTMLQPRRVAARSAASRIAQERGWTLGDQVGYQVRFDKQIARHTPLRIVTEGVLVRRLVADPSLDGTACVVLDEFHERSLDADLSLAMLREAKAALRPDLRLIVMSATLDADAVAAFLGENAEILHVPGRLFPVEVEHRRDDPRPVEERVASAIGGAMTGGDVLVFLPGVREIEATMDAVRPVARRHGYGVVPLHGSLNKSEQDAAVRFDPTGPPRVICATNVAETSLTLPGVRTVIDSGLVRRAGYDARRGVATLTTERISKASAEQRAGRAGRSAEGRCVRLWSAMTHRTLPDYDLPEVRRADLCDAALTVRAWGGEPASFGWYEPPDADLLAAADRLLELLGATDGGRLTTLGRRLQDLPLHPRLARLLVAAPPHLKRVAATVAALVGEQVDVPGRRTATVRDLLAAHDAGKLDAPGLGRARDALLRRVDSSEPADVDSLEELLLLAHPDRVCRRRSADAATLATGGGVRLPEPSAVRGDWFLALDLRRGNFAQKQQADVSLVAEIDPAWLEDAGITETAAEWDGSRVVAVRRKRYLALVLDEQPGGKPDPIAAAEVLRRHVTPDVLDADANLQSLRRRLAMLAIHLPTHLRPDGEVDESNVLDDAVAAAVGAGEPSLSGVAKRAADALQNRLYAGGWHRALSEFAPTHLEVPTGSNIALDWTAADAGEPRGPVLAVRLQELFGLAQTPRVCGGTVPVTLRLLAPNMRPQQTTDDLASFWANTYPQVRKDLRARYPKHSWPDDPLSAVPTRGAKRRREA